MCTCTYIVVYGCVSEYGYVCRSIHVYIHTYIPASRMEGSVRIGLFLTPQVGVSTKATMVLTVLWGLALIIISSSSTYYIYIYIVPNNNNSTISSSTLHITTTSALGTVARLCGRGGFPQKLWLLFCFVIVIDTSSWCVNKGHLAEIAQGCGVHIQLDGEDQNTSNKRKKPYSTQRNKHIVNKLHVTKT